MPLFIFSYEDGETEYILAKTYDESFDKSKIDVGKRLISIIYFEEAFPTQGGGQEETQKEKDYVRRTSV